MIGEGGREKGRVGRGAGGVRDGRPSLTGRPTKNMLGMRRRMAESTSCGRLVAPMIITRHVGSVTSPSQKLMNCVFIIAVASWSDELRVRRNESAWQRRGGGGGGGNDHGRADTHVSTQLSVSSRSIVARISCQ